MSSPCGCTAQTTRNCYSNVQAPRLVLTTSNDDDNEQEIPSDETSTEEVPTNNDNDDSEYTDSEEEENAHPNDPAAAPGRTRARRMPVDERSGTVSKGTASCGRQDPHKATDLSSPVGTAMKKYQRKKMNFVVSLADGPDAADYHDQVQTLAIWFIETADCVNLRSTEGGGYWKVFYVFAKHSSTRYSLVGYMTVFHFLSPFKKPKSGIVARVCQILILAPYQRMGHGKMLLQQVYNMVHDSNNNNNIVELNVEDPAPACTNLRNQLDYQMLKASLSRSSHASPWLDSKYYSTTDTSRSDFFQPVSDADAVQAGAVARITPRQVQIAHEIYKLSLLPEDCSEEVQKNYRLMVKKRLAKVHREELGVCPSKEEKQAMLAKIFDETLEQYKSVLKRSK